MDFEGPDFQHAFARAWDGDAAGVARRVEARGAVASEAEVVLATGGE